MAITNPQDTIDVTFTLPREAWENPAGILDAFAAAYHWQERVQSQDEKDPTFDAETKTVANPITKQQNAINWVQNYIDDIWTAHVSKVSAAPVEEKIKAGLKETRKVVRDNTKVNVKGKSL